MIKKTNFDNQKIKEILLKGHYLSENDLNKALAEVENKKLLLDKYLLEFGLLTKDLLGQAMAEYFKVDYADLNTLQPSRDQILKISQEVAEKYNAILFKENKKEVTVTTDNPQQEGLGEEMSKIFADKKVRLTYSLFEDIEPLFKNYKEKLETRFNKIINEQKKIAPEIIDEIIKDGIAFHASDIHLEPQEKDVLVRFRIDGVLQAEGALFKYY